MGRRARAINTRIDANRKAGRATWDVYGLKDCIDDIKAFMADMEGKPSESTIQKTAWQVVGEAAKSARRILEFSVKSKLPGGTSRADYRKRGVQSGTKMVLDSIFTYSRRNVLHPSPSAIFGVEKGESWGGTAPAYLEWYAKDKGRLIGKSLATMAEQGNPGFTPGKKVSWKTPRPFFKPVWGQIKATVIQRLINGYKDIANYYR